MLETIFLSLLGGALIGAAASILLVLNGRVASVSGIYYGILQFFKGDFAWRIYFVLGLVFGGLVMFLNFPSLFEPQTDRSLMAISVGGILVGFGSVLGSGCTIGHGVCGLSRKSKRSLTAVVVFLAAGIIAANLYSQF